MYIYHVFGGIYKERYYFIRYSDPWLSYNPHNWTSYPREINLHTTANDIFENIKYTKERYEKFKSLNFHNNNTMAISEIYLYINATKPRILLKENRFTGTYKEFITIETDIELRDSEIINIDDVDYVIKYKYNVDTKNHELYINKVVEVIVDQKLLKHARKVCNEVVKKILKYNEEIEKQKILVNNYKENESIENSNNNILKSKDKQRKNRIIDDLKVLIKRLLKL